VRLVLERPGRGAPSPSSSGVDAVSLWSLCTEHARGKVSGDWSFPYSDGVKVTLHGKAWTVSGPVDGPASQTFTLSCTYANVTADGATLKDYNLA
jgi:hypothetical protein